MKIKCPRCQAVQESAKFCNNCGVQFAPVQPLPVQGKPQNLGNNNWKVGVIILVACILFAVAAQFLPESRPKQQPAQVVKNEPPDPDERIIGKKPLQSSWDAEVLPVKRYLRTHLNDYDSSEFVEWSRVTKVTVDGQKYWGVRLKLRAKNAFGGYILRDTYYYMRHDEVKFATGLSAE